MSGTRDSATDTAYPAGYPPAPQSSGWFRSFCLALLVLILVTTCAVGGAIVLVIRQVITVPPGLIAAFTGGPAPVTIQGTTVLERIQSLSELMTTRYNYSSLVTSQRDMPGILNGLYGDKLLMVAVGHITAGIDVKNVTISGSSADTLTIQMPAPHLIDCFLDEKSSYVVSRDTGLFAKPAPNLDQEARRFAVAEFRKSALDANIYNEVQTHAQTILNNFVLGMGVKKVTILTTPPDPNTPLPDSCQ
ncbi:MAG: DUF4230 domain-containing protein [Chloroflexota bacterium]